MASRACTQQQTTQAGGISTACDSVHKRLAHTNMSFRHSCQLWLLLLPQTHSPHPAAAVTLACSVLMSLRACASALTAPASRMARTTSRDMALLLAWRGSLRPPRVLLLVTRAPIRAMQADA